MIIGTRYQIIANEILKKIEEGYYKLNSVLPSQNALSNEYDCSLMTIRKSIEMLEKHGILRSEHGVGVFIENTHPKRDFMLSSFTNKINEKHIPIHTKVIKKEYDVKANIYIQGIFGKKEKLACLTRLRYFEEAPIILQYSYTPMKYKHVFEKYQNEISLYDLFASETSSIMSEAREIVDAINVNEYQAKILKIKKNTSAICSTRVNLDIRNNIVLLDEVILVRHKVILMNHLVGKYQISHYGIIENDKNSYEKFIDSKYWNKELL